MDIKARLESKSGRERIELGLELANGRARKRTLTISDIDTILEMALKRPGISKKAMHGTIVHYTGGFDYPNAYKLKAKRPPESTHFTAKYSSTNGWTVLQIWRDTAPQDSINVWYCFSESAEAAVLKEARKTHILGY